MEIIGSHVKAIKVKFYATIGITKEDTILPLVTFC